ncbi:MAG: hypothetical protein WKF73_13965 [Nocardioidaceae bacterium]
MSSHHRVSVRVVGKVALRDGSVCGQPGQRGEEHELDVGKGEG